MFNKGQQLTDKQGNLFEIMMVTKRPEESVEYEVAAVALKGSWFVMSSEEITESFTATQKTKTVNVYSYSELGERAKDKVKHWLNDGDSFALTEQLEYDLADHYGIPNAELSYSLGYCQGDGVSFTGSWSGEEAIAILNKVYDGEVPTRLLKILPYFTMNFNRISRNYAHERTVNTELLCERYYSNTLGKFIEECEEAIESWRISICKDLEKTGYSQLEYENSEEYMVETCEANGYEFYESGELA